jgi:hypothetical protein
MISCILELSWIVLMQTCGMQQPLHAIGDLFEPKRFFFFFFLSEPLATQSATIKTTPP